MLFFITIISNGLTNFRDFFWEKNRQNLKSFLRNLYRYRTRFFTRSTARLWRFRGRIEIVKSLWRTGFNQKNIQKGDVGLAHPNIRTEVVS